MKLRRREWLLPGIALAPIWGVMFLAGCVSGPQGPPSLAPRDELLIDSLLTEPGTIPSQARLLDFVAYDNPSAPAAISFLRRRYRETEDREAFNWITGALVTAQCQASLSEDDLYSDFYWAIGMEGFRSSTVLTFLELVRMSVRERLVPILAEKYRRGDGPEHMLSYGNALRISGEAGRRAFASLAGDSSAAPHVRNQAQFFLEGWGTQPAPLVDPEEVCR